MLPGACFCAGTKRTIWGSLGLRSLFLANNVQLFLLQPGNAQSVSHMEIPLSAAYEDVSDGIYTINGNKKTIKMMGL